MLRTGGTRLQGIRARAAHLVPLAIAALLLTGCGDDDPDAVALTTTTGPTTAAQVTDTTAVAGAAPSPAASSIAPATVTSTAATTGTAAPGADPRVAAARRDLAGRKGYDPDAIAVAGIEEVTWPNAALGCPATGREYAQASVPGYRIILTWRDLEYAYHGAEGELPFLCQYLD